MTRNEYRRNNESGIALITTLFFVLILYGLSSVFILSAVNEIRTAKLDREKTKTFYVAQGGAQVALDQLDTMVNNYLLTTISNAAPSGVIGYANARVAAGDGIGWLVYAVRNNNVPVLTQNGEQAEYSGEGVLGGRTYQYSIVITEKTDPVASGADQWDFPYVYTITADSSSGGVASRVRLTGDFTVRLQRDNFAKFALFTNSQTTPSGYNVWFTDKTNFAGPVHTNGRFNFALNPSGTFEEAVSQQETLARFYNYGWTVLLDDDHNLNRDVPTFKETFERGASAITLNSSTQEQDMENQASGGQTFTGNGVYVPANGSSLIGGVLVKGDSAITMSVDANNNAVYTIAQGNDTTTITVDQVNQQTTVYDSASDTTQVYNGVPDGQDDVGTLIYVDGNITGIGGTVQADTELTVASKYNMNITDHIQYASYTPAVGSPGDSNYVPPSAEGTNNLLGLVSWQGNVTIGTSAPDNINIHGTILATNGIFTVTDYNDTNTGPRGTATLLGGVITDNYGAFGLFNGYTGQQMSGYGRNFVYDQRMKVGKQPPYFPSLNTFIAFTNDIADKIVWQEGS